MCVSSTRHLLPAGRRCSRAASPKRGEEALDPTVDGAAINHETAQRTILQNRHHDIQ